jgi:hypothetical protein
MAGHNVEPMPVRSLLLAAVVIVAGCGGKSAPSVVQIPVEVPRVVASVQAPAPPAIRCDEQVRRAESRPDPGLIHRPLRRPERPGYVARERVNLRPCPQETPRCAPTSLLRQNDEVRVLSTHENWLRIRVLRLGQEGFVARRFIAPTRTAVVRPAPIRESVIPAAGKSKAVQVEQRGEGKLHPQEELIP